MFGPSTQTHSLRYTIISENTMEQSRPPPDPTCPGLLRRRQPVDGRLHEGHAVCPSVSVLAAPLSRNQKLLMLMKGAPLLGLPDTCSLFVHGSSVVAPLHHHHPPCVCVCVVIVEGGVPGLIHCQVKPSRRSPGAPSSA